MCFVFRSYQTPHMLPASPSSMAKIMSFETPRDFPHTTPSPSTLTLASPLPLTPYPSPRPTTPLRCIPPPPQPSHVYHIILTSHPSLASGILPSLLPSTHSQKLHPIFALKNSSNAMHASFQVLPSCAPAMKWVSGARLE